MTSFPWIKLPTAMVRATLAGHSGLGLAVAALLYMICLTGTVLVFDHELRRWENPEGPIMVALTAEDAEQAVRDAVALFEGRPEGDNLLIHVPTEDMPRLMVQGFDSKSGTNETWVMAPDGMAPRRLMIPFVEFLSAHHIHLLLPRTIGLLVVGLLGLCLLAAILSGVIAHPRIFKDAFTLRLGGTRRLREADLHNRLSVWGLPFHVIIALTGSVFGLSLLLLGSLAFVVYDGDIGRAQAELGGVSVAENPQPAPLAPVAGPIIQLQDRFPTAQLDRIHVQRAGTEGQSVTLYAKNPTQLADSSRYVFDGSGQPVGDALTLPPGFGQRLLGLLPTLHFGWFGGPFVKLAYGLLGLALTTVVASSISIWVARRQDQGRAVPHLDRLWCAFIWGQPTAFAIAAGATLIGIGAHLPYFGASIVCLGLSGLIRNTQRLSFTLKGLLAICLVMLGFLHAWLSSGRMTDPMGRIVDTILVLIALVIAAFAITAARRYEHTTHDPEARSTAAEDIVKGTRL